MDHAPRPAGLPQDLVIIAIGLLPMMAILALMPIVPALVQNFQHIPGIQTLAPLVLAAPGFCVARYRFLRPAANPNISPINSPNG